MRAILTVSMTVKVNSALFQSLDDRLLNSPIDNGAGMTDKNGGVSVPSAAICAAAPLPFRLFLTLVERHWLPSQNLHLRFVSSP